MYNFSYRETLRTAWHFTKKFKFLWFFGIFASLATNGAEYDTIVRNFDTVKDFELKIEGLQNFSLGDFVAAAWSSVVNYFTHNVFSALAIIFAGILVSFGIIYLITVSQVAIIDGVARFRRKDNAEFIEGFFIGTKNFWPIFILNLFAKIVMYGLLLIFGLPLIYFYFSTKNFVWLSITSVLAFLVLIPLNLFFTFIIRYASIYIILRGKKTFEALKQSLILFRKNWLISLENAVIMYVINFGIIFVIISVLTLLGLPFSNTGYLFYFSITTLAGAIITVFQFGVWTELFYCLEEGRGVAKLVRWFKKNPEEKK